MKNSRFVSLSAFGVLVSLMGGSTLTGEEEVSLVRPVDDDMHHFMEYVFEPSYKRLKTQMAEEPKDKEGWKAIKGDSLTLAEVANLLMTRAPDEDADAWREQSAAVRVHGGELYQAARKSDFAAARKAYVTMLNNCNACHTKFADGKHQLQP